MPQKTVQTEFILTVKKQTAQAWKLVSDNKTAYGATYRGPAERCTVSWTIGVVTGISAIDDWARTKTIGDIQNALAQRGGKLLRVQVYNKLSPSGIFGTMEPFDWKVVIDADVTGETSAPATAAAMRSPFPWSFVIGLSLVAIALLMLKWTIDSVSNLVYGPGGTGGVAMGGVLLLGALALGAYALSKQNKARKDRR